MSVQQSRSKGRHEVVAETYLVLIDNAATWVALFDLSMRVHILSLRGRIEPEALTPSQKQVQIVMEIMMQPATSSCKYSQQNLGCSVMIKQQT